MKIVFLSTLFTAFFTYSFYAQIIEPSTGIEKQLLQLEIETQYSKQKTAAEKSISWSIPNALFRYGLTDRIELQLNTPIVTEKLYQHNHLVHSLNKFDAIQLGFSIDLIEEKKLRPEASLMARIILPMENNFQFKKTGQILALNFSNLLSNKFIFQYNIGFSHATDTSNSGYYIVNLTYYMNSKLHFFIEKFADFTNKTVLSQTISAGFGYNFKENLMIDYSIASGIDHHHFYTGLILTWVINTKQG